MSSIVVSGDTSGAVTLSAPAVAGTVTVTLPSASGTMASLASVTNNGVAYVNSSGQTTTGSALVFDGTNLGLGVTPSAWTGAEWTAFEGAYGGALAFYKASNVPVTVLTSNAYHNSGWKYKTTDPALQYEMDGNGGTYKWYQAASGTAGNAITFTQAMTLDASGNLLLGQTTNTQNYRFVLKGSAGTADDLAINTDATRAEIQSFNSKALELNRQGNNVLVCSAGSGNLLVGTTSGPVTSRITSNYPGNTTLGLTLVDTTAAGGTAVRFYTNSTGFVGSITTSSTATAYNTSSDYRLKENIAPMTGALATVSALKPCTYTWKSTGEASQGFIAHELQEVVPDCVTGEKDAVDEDGNPVYQGIDTSFLVATLTAAIQELKAELDTAKAQIAALQGAA